MAAASFDTASTDADDTVQDMIRKDQPAGGELVGELVGSTCEDQILEKLAGGEPDKLQLLHYCRVNAVPTNKVVGVILGVARYIGERFCFWAPNAVDEVEAGDQTEISPPRPASGLVHVTLVNQKMIPVGRTGDFSSCVGHVVEAYPADSLAYATVHHPDRVIADPVGVVVRPPGAPDTVVADEAAAAATVNLGDAENPIDVGAMSRSDFELILAVCPRLG